MNKGAKNHLMRRSCRIFLNDLNSGKASQLYNFLRLSRDIRQYYVDIFWQRKDFSTGYDKELVARVQNKFQLTNRLSRVLERVAKETLRSQRKFRIRKPRIHSYCVNLAETVFYLEAFNGEGFDYAIRFHCGPPKITIPFKSTKPLNKFLADGWTFANTIRLGNRKGRLFVDLILNKPRLPIRSKGRIVGMDSNYKAGMVMSTGQIVGADIYPRIQQFTKRQKHTHAEVASMLGRAIKEINLRGVKTLVVEDLKRVKHGKRRTFRRVFNRRLSHWLYRLCFSLLERRCEGLGIQLERKNPYKTSQYCRRCGKWDRRNRAGDKFKCIHCGFTQNADFNAALNLKLLGEAGVYGLRLLQNPEG